MAFWTGLNDRNVEGEYKWSDGTLLEYADPITTATSPPWLPGEPKDYGVSVNTNNFAISITIVLYI